MEIANSVGTIVATRYQIAELLGEGGSGSTYRAIRLEDGAAVAIKILSLRHLNDWKQLELFEREAKVLSQLNHPQIPKYLEYFHVDTPENRAFYIVQQLAPGKPLTAWVQSGWRGTEADVRDIASQLLAILQYLHQHAPPLIHRDLKPHNIIRNDDGRVFLVDFGAVQAVYNNTLLKGSTVAGTFGYMAPEQFRGLAVPASDLYGLGATILYLLTHRSPADLPQERLKLSFRAHVNISNHFADWLEKMLEPDTSERFASANVALSALQKQHRFRVQRGHQIGSPWKGVAIAAIILSISVSLIDRYRYAFLNVIGLAPNGLCEAIGRQDIDSLHRYISQGGNVNTEVEISYLNNRNDIYISINASLLHCAIRNRQPEIVAYLVKNGADLYSLNSDGESPLMSAVRSANDSAFKYLIQAGVNPNIMKDTDGELSAWYVLAWHSVKDREAIRSIAEQLIAAKVDINKQDNSGDTPLHSAILAGNQPAIDFLLNYKARTDIENKHGDTALFAAIRSQNDRTVELLISRGAEINTPNKDGKTPLMIAIDGAKSYKDNFTEQTFKNPAIPTSDTNQTIQKIIKLLIDKGADPNIADRDGNTAFHLLGNLGEILSNYDSCTQGRSIAIYTLDLLMRHKINFQAVNKDGDTALHVVARQDFFPVVDRMIRYGWNPLQKNYQGKNIYQSMKVVTPRIPRCENAGGN
jgi:ankyrin repeat protein